MQRIPTSLASETPRVDRQDRCAEEAALALSRRVRIKAGLLRGYEGTAVLHRKDGRVLIAIQGPANGVRLEIDAEFVEILE